MRGINDTECEICSGEGVTVTVYLDGREDTECCDACGRFPDSFAAAVAIAERDGTTEFVMRKAHDADGAWWIAGSLVALSTRRRRVRLLRAFVLVVKDSRIAALGAATQQVVVGK